MLAKIRSFLHSCDLYQFLHDVYSGSERVHRDTFNTIKRYDIMYQEYHKGARENEDLLPPEN